MQWMRRPTRTTISSLIDEQHYRPGIWSGQATQTGFPMSSCESMCVCMRVYEYVGDSQWFWDNIKSSKTVKCQIGNDHLFKLFCIKCILPFKGFGQ